MTKGWMARLEEGMAYRLTLLLSCDEDGRTSLLCRRMASSMARVAWVTLTEVDDELTRFSAHIAAALASLLPAPPPPEGEVEARLNLLLNAFVDVPGEAVVVLDEYHHVTAPEVHALVSTMVDYLPPSLHLYLISCSPPPMPLARWRVRRQLLEIDLRSACNKNNLLIK
jgi:LuxR family maltose regulon positive regulatory protein